MYFSATHHFIDDEGVPLSFTDPRIEEALKELRPKVIVFDPFQAFLGSNVDMHRANEVRPIMSKLGKLAEKYNCAIIIIVHMSKMTQASALHRTLGSIDIVALARSALLIGLDPADPDTKILAHVKSSLAAHGDSLKWHYDGQKGVVFDGISDLQADDIVNSARTRKESDKPKIERAKDLILNALKRTGYATKDSIVEMAENAGIAKSTLYNAKKSMGIKDDSAGFGENRKAWWYMPELRKEDLPLEGEQTNIANP